MKAPEEIELAKQNSQNIANVLLIPALNYEAIVLSKSGLKQKAVALKMGKGITATEVNNMIRAVYRIMNKNRKPEEPKVDTISGIYTKLEMFAF